jgi:hypothetical protein
VSKPISDYRPYVALAMALCPGKIKAQDEGPLALRLDQLARHVLLAGGSGMGKTELLKLLMRQLAGLKGPKVGFTFITPHEDACEEMVDYFAASGVPPERVHYIKPGDPSAGISLDLFASPPDRADLLRYKSWLSATADLILRAFLRNVPAADQEVMRRLKRWAKNVLVAAGLEAEGGRLGIDNALLLTDPSLPEFAAAWAKVGPELQRVFPEVHHDFVKLQTSYERNRDPQRQEAWVESTVNLLRDLLQPAVQQMFGRMAPSLSMREVILGGQIQLLNLAETDYLAADQGNQVGGLWINWMMATARRIAQERAKDDRVWHVLIVDEAPNYIAEDLGRSFVELRKFRMPIVLTVQDLAGLRKGDQVDLVSRTFSQCGIQMTFQQQDAEDVEYFARQMKYGDLDLTPLMLEHTLFKGYQKVFTRSVSAGAGASETRSESESRTRTRTVTSQTHTAASVQRSFALALAASRSEGESETEASGGSAGHTKGTSLTNSSAHSTQDAWSEGGSRASNQSMTTPLLEGNPTENKGTSVTTTEGKSRSAGATETCSLGETEQFSRQWNWSAGRGRNSSDTRGLTVTGGVGAGLTTGASQGEAHGESEGATTGKAEGKSRSLTLTVNEGYQADQEVVLRPNGKTVVAVTDQVYAMVNLLKTLPPRHAAVRVQGMRSPFVLEVWEVKDPYVERNQARPPCFRAARRGRYLAQVREAHACYFTPDEAARRRRLEQWLGGGASAAGKSGAALAGEGPEAPPEPPPTGPQDHPFNL